MEQGDKDLCLRRHMKKSLKLFILLFKINGMQEAEYRVNMVVNSLMNIGWILSYIIFTQLIFGHVTSIAGWTRPEVVLLVITHILSADLLMFSVLPGLSNLTEKIKRGSLDQLLTKPVSPRLALAIFDQNIDDSVRMPILVILLIILSRNINPIPSALVYITYFVLIILGSFILYNVFFILHTTAFWLIDLFNIDHLTNNISGVAQIPPDAFSIKIRLVLCYLLPTVFIAAVPTRILLGGPILPSLILAIIVAIITFIISQMFWNFALKHYSSASS